MSTVLSPSSSTLGENQHPFTSDSSVFGGICYQGGMAEETFPWVQDGSFVVPHPARSRAYVAPLVADELALGRLAYGVGRLLVNNYLSSGWIASGTTRKYFISTTRNLDSVPSLPPGIVTFTSYWNGNIPSTPSGVRSTTFFEVDFVAFHPTAQLSVWRFRTEDEPFLPPAIPLSARSFAVGDGAVLFGYCGFPEMTKLTKYFLDLPDHVKGGALPPTLETACIILQPNAKIASPGKVVATVAADPAGVLGFRIEATSYHGMSGGPCILATTENGQRHLGVAGAVVGAILSEHTLGNTVANLLHPIVTTFFQSQLV